MLASKLKQAFFKQALTMLAACVLLEPVNDESIEVQAEIKPDVQSLGGIARAKRLTSDQRSAIAQAAAEARWDKDGGVTTPRATHTGNLTLIEGKEIACAVLEDGTRVLTTHGVMKALGRPWKGTYRTMSRPNFLAGPNLEPYIDDSLRAVLTPLDFRMPKGGYAKGYKAEILPKVCEVYLKARDGGALVKGKQMEVARSADLLMRALAHVGITALVDEATGYQEVRDRKALQEVLRKYITGALFEWTNTFPLEFYKEMFRLKGWTWNDGKMPSVVGRYTNDLVYNRLAPGVLDELKRVNPTDEKGHRKYRHHQYLTRDVGHPSLTRRLYELIGMARACDKWERFYHLVDRNFPKLNATLALPLSGESGVSD